LAQELEVGHSYTSGGEAAAIKVVVDEFTKRGGTWVDESIAGFDNAGAAFVARVAAGDPPGAKNFVIGMDAREWIDQGYMADIDSVAVEVGLKELLPPLVYDAIDVDGHIYQAPLMISGQNWMFYSKQVFDKVGIAEAPTTWDAFFADMDKVKEAGLIPIAWGGQSWQQIKVFNTALISEVGPENFVKFYRDSDTSVVESPEFANALTIFGKMREYVDDASPGRNWNDATSMVINNQAAVQFLGDFAKGEFTAAGKVAGTDYGCAVSPGTETLIVLGDGFTFPKSDDPGVTAAQQLLAEVLLDPVVQVDFSLHKGSFPVRTDADLSKLDECAALGVSHMEAGTVVPEHAVLMDPNNSGILQDILAEYWSDASMSPADLQARLAGEMSSW
jgi:glucose/mannose transport system substrate-binding protein